MSYAQKDKTRDVYRILKKRIFSGFYWPKQHLVETVLSEDLGVKRTIVREALKHLAIEGLVFTESYKGCKVADISVEQVKEAYQIEAVLEGFAAFLAANRMNAGEVTKLGHLIDESKKVDYEDLEKWALYNRQIHRLINKASRNNRLIDLIGNNIEFHNYWFIVLSAPGEIPKNNQKHKAILDAIKSRNARKARELMEDHILRSADGIVERVRDTFPAIKANIAK